MGNEKVTTPKPTQKELKEAITHQAVVIEDREKHIEMLENEIAHIASDRDFATKEVASLKREIELQEYTIKVLKDSLYATTDTLKNLAKQSEITMHNLEIIKELGGTSK